MGLAVVRISPIPAGWKGGYKNEALRDVTARAATNSLRSELDYNPKPRHIYTRSRENASLMSPLHVDWQFNLYLHHWPAKHDWSTGPKSNTNNKLQRRAPSILCSDDLISLTYSLSPPPTYLNMLLETATGSLPAATEVFRIAVKAIWNNQLSWWHCFNELYTI